MPPTPRLSAKQIVDVAVAQLKERGYDQVSMRSIAAALDTGQASLYAHVANRDELDDLVLDRVSAAIHVPEADARTWQEQLKEVARSTLAAYRAHPGVARVSMARIPVSPASLSGAERLLAILLAGKVDPQHAAWFIDVLMQYVGAVAFEDELWKARARHNGEESVIAKVRRTFESLPPHEFPLITEHASTMTTGGGEARFEFGLDLLVTGLATMGTTGGTSTTSRSPGRRRS